MGGGGKISRFWTIGTITFSLQFIFDNIALIQITLFLLWATVESLHLILRGKYIVGGVLLAFAINIKILPIILLPYLFYRAYFKAVWVVGISIAVFLWLPALFIGYDYNTQLLVHWWHTINPNNAEHMLETQFGGLSLSACIPVYLMDSMGEMPTYARNFINLPPIWIENILNTTRVLLYGFGLLYIRARPFQKASTPLQTIYEISYFLLLIPLLMPHQNKYNFIFCVPLISYLLYFFIRTFAHRAVFPISYHITFYVFVLCMLFFSPFYGSDIIGRFAFNLTKHYKILTFITLLLIPISYYARPAKLVSLLALMDLKK